MRVCVNGKWHDVGAARLDTALDELGYGNTVVATALNGSFVAANARGMTKLAEDDRIEIVAPMQGG